MARKNKEEWKIEGNVFDQFTIRIIQKLMSQRIIEGIESPLKIGKEANVFTALTEDDQKRIVKIYRLESCNFNQMYGYIKSDNRFIDIKKQRRQVIFTWVKREHKNLILARKAGVRVPTPIMYVNHLLILEYIGDGENDDVAPQLKDSAPQDPEEFKEFMDEVISQVRLLYQKAGLIHADLSEFNILNSNGHPVLIDFSQTTTRRDINARMYLERDINNLIRFSKKHGLILDYDDVHERITKE